MSSYYLSITSKHDKYRCASCRRTFRKPKHRRCPFCHHKHYHSIKRKIQKK